MAYLYRHIRIDTNEPFYIGIGSDCNFQRATSKIGRNLFWKKITTKTDYLIEIMLDGLTWEDACKKEKEFIQLYGRRDLGVGTLTNMTDGGEGQLNPSDETRLKLQYVKSSEHRKKLSNAKLGTNNPFYLKKRKGHSDWLLKNHPNRKPVIQYDLNNNVIKEWNSAKDVENMIQIKHKNISACCRGNRKTAGGYIWKFKN